MKIFTRLFLIITLLGVQLLGFAATHTITVTSSAFSPNALIINQGDVVVFQWQSGSHHVMSDNNSFADFMVNSSNPSKTLNLTNAGNFGYHSMTAHNVTGNITVRMVSGMKDVKQVPTLNAFPNPTRGETTITLNQAAGEQYKIRISNAIGRIIKTVELKDRDFHNGVVIDMSDMPSGFYFYSLLANDKMIETKRLVVRR